MTKLKAAVVGTAIVVVVVTPLIIQYQTQVRLREDNHLLRQKLDQLSEVALENERLPNLVIQAQSTASVSKDQFNELLRLRAEVGGLRQQLKDIEASRKTVRTGSTPP